jgi:MFS transporter, DHA1 family, inner membrane transport protein
VASSTQRSNHSEIFALAVILMAGVASVMLMPLIASILVTRFGFAVSRVGYVAALELFMLALGSSGLAPRFDQVPPRTFLGVTLSLLALANIGCLITGSGAVVVACRGVVGLASGLTQAFALGAASRTLRPHRAFSAMYTAAAIELTATYLLMPQLEELWGSSATFALILAFSLGGLAVLPLLSASPLRIERPLVHPVTPQAPSPREMYLILVAWFSFHLGQVGIWTYVERITASLQFTFRQTNYLLAASCLLAIFAALLAAWCGRRFATAWPIIVTVLVSSLSIFLMTSLHNKVAFVANFLAYGSIIYFAFPFFSTLASEVDSTGKMAALLPAAQALGASAGPAISSFVLANSDSLHRVSLANGAISLLAFLAVIPALRADRYHEADSNGGLPNRRDRNPAAT